MLCCVFDGHGGRDVSRYVEHNFKRIFIETQQFKDGKYEEALKESFRVIDDEIRQGGSEEKGKLEKEAIEEQGTTACVVYFNKEKLWCSNAGDSRGCMKRQDDDNEEEDKADEENVIPLSFDHKPNNKSETQRIYKIKHYVDATTNRVDGTLAVARAFGDHQYKDKMDKGDWSE